MAHFQRVVSLRRLALAGAALLMALLTGCADTGLLRTEVSSYGAWPAGRTPGSFAFERLPSQEASPELQTQLEDAAQPALARAGFQQAPTEQAAQYLVQVASRVRIDRRYSYAPVFPVWVPYSHHYGPRGSIRGGWGPGRGGIGYSMVLEPPYVQMQVDMLIRDRQNNLVVYETHAMLDRIGSANPALFAPLFDAALKDFPQPAISPRVVTVPLHPESAQ